MAGDLENDTVGLGSVERALRRFAAVILGFLFVVLAYLVVWPIKLEEWPPPKYFLAMSIFMVVSLIMCAFLLFHFRRTLLSSKVKLASITYRDGRTGLYNHRYIRERLGQEIDRAARYQRPLSVACADIDGIARIRAQMGLARRNELVEKVADRLSSQIRATDLLGRTASGEFILILTETASSEAESGARRLQEACRVEPFRLSRTVSPVSVSLSFGLVACEAGWQTPDAAIEAARRALAAAQTEGDNRVARA